MVVLLSATASAAQFTSGPSVRVTPNTQVVFKWNTDVAWFGRIDVFDNAAGTGNPVLTKNAEDGTGAPLALTDQVVTVPIVGVGLQADTTYYFRITAVDPTKINPDLVAPFLPLFTGVQALTNPQISADATSAEISWQGNVIGLGKLEFGTSTLYGDTETDTSNTTDHTFSLFGLQPATTYFYRLSNVHAIDGDSLVSITGSFDTLPTISAQFLQPLDQSTDSANPIVNTGKNGKVIFVKVKLTQGSTVVTAQNAPGPVSIAVTKLATCSTIAGSDPIESYADIGQSSAGTNQFRFDPGSQSWTYGLDTKALGLITGNCYRIDVYVDGSKVSNAFAVFQPNK